MTKRELMNLSDTKLDHAVKIQGTNYDRKRKVTKQIQQRMMQMLKAGKTVNEIAEHFSVVPQTVRYNTDPEWKASYNASRSGKHYGTNSNVKDRVSYKRELLENRNSRKAVIYA